MKRFWGVTVAAGDGENNLIFAPDVESLERVAASAYFVRGMARLHPIVDIGSAVGFMRFTARPGITVSRFVVDPVVGFRPLAIGLPETEKRVHEFFARAVEIYVGAIIFPQGFRVTDFGAIGGPDLDGGAEVSPHAGLRISVVF